MSNNNPDTKLTLEKSLEAFRVLAAPAAQSWKIHYAQETFSSPDLWLCTPEEQDRFSQRLKECACTIHPNIKMPAGSTVPPVTLYELIQTLSNPQYQNIPKHNRKVIFSTANGERPAGNRAFLIWNGFQVIDMDIRDERLAGLLKQHIFQVLHKCNWFLGVTFSASGTGLHIYTKITVPEEYQEDLKKRKLLFLTNFRHKYSFIYLACLSAMETLGFTKEDLQKWMDISMLRPAQGAYIGYDSHPLISTRFFEDFIYICFDNVEDIGHPEIDWVSHPDLKVIFSRWEWFEESEDDAPSVELANSKAEAGPDGAEHAKVHYKHQERWRLANTLVNIFGLQQATRYMRSITSNKVPDKELVADCTTAARHQKPIDPWAVNRLNRNHGFHIKLNVENIQVGESDLLNAMDRIENPNHIIPSKYYYKFNITKHQYLSHIMDSIMGKTGRITLIEAGPGLGKTEMVKELVKKGKKVMMVLPFTSVIKSKIENEEGWYYSYGSRKPKLDVEQGLALTVDKFSRIPMMDIKLAGFDYIFLDESHLLFMSEYRPVMSKVIEMIRNTEVPIILMSGTPTGELVFFPDIVHIHVIKEETRQKELEINMVDNTSHLLYHMCRAMADDIASGKRILFPSNEGTTFSKRMQAGVQYFLQLNHSIFEPIQMKYYKKSNLGEEFMDGVNFEKTIRDVQMVMCTTYMGCGVDIEDRYDFQIYFGDLCTAAECDQWCNRLRNNNLYVKMYVAKNDEDGNSREIHKFHPLNFQLQDEEIKNIHSILRICNAMIERNPIEYKYNSIVSSIIHDNRYVVYDEINSKYYIDDIAYKTVNFERKYRDYAEQLPVFMKGMQAYGYRVSARDLGSFDVGGSEIFGNLKDVVKMASDEQLSLNTSHIEELMDLITEDRLEIYKEVLNGRFEIKKGNIWKEDITNMVMTVKNVEVFEKVVPIFVSMSKRYNVETIREIFEYCRTKHRYNFAAIQRIRTLINILDAEENQRLDLPIRKFMLAAWEFAEAGSCHKMDLDKFLVNFATQYAEQDSTVEVLIANSPLTIKKLKNTFERIFKCLVQCSRPKKDGTIHMERQELLWKKRSLFGTDNPNDNIYTLEDFLESIVPIDSAKIVSVRPSQPISKTIDGVPV